MVMMSSPRTHYRLHGREGTQGTVAVRFLTWHRIAGTLRLWLWLKDENQIL